MIHIELTRADTYGRGVKVRLALEQIASWTAAEREGTYIYHPDNSAWLVKESYDEVTERINQATQGEG